MYHHVFRLSKSIGLKKPLIFGSNPAGPTIFFPILHYYSLYSSLQRDIFQDKSFDSGNSVYFGSGIRISFFSCNGAEVFSGSK